MATIPGTDYQVDLRPGENILLSTPADGFFASKHSAVSTRWYIAVTDSRFIVFSVRGFVKKKIDQRADWPLSSFTSRINTSSGSALGSFMHVLTLFTADGETVSTGFRASSDCERFKEQVVQALLPILD